MLTPAPEPAATGGGKYLCTCGKYWQVGVLCGVANTKQELNLMHHMITRYNII